MKTASIILVGTIFFALSFSVSARKPAVLPVTGISIDEYKVIPPEDAKVPGYDFSSQVPVKKNYTDPASTTTAEAPRASRSNTVQAALEEKARKDMQALPILIGLLIIALPAFLWFGIMRKVDRLPPDQLKEETIDNTISLAEEREKRIPGDDDDVSKAS